MRGRCGVCINMYEEKTVEETNSVEQKLKLLMIKLDSRPPYWPPNHIFVNRQRKCKFDTMTVSRATCNNPLLSPGETLYTFIFHSAVVCLTPPPTLPCDRGASFSRFTSGQSDGDGKGRMQIQCKDVKVKKKNHTWSVHFWFSFPEFMLEYKQADEVTLVSPPVQQTVEIYCCQSSVFFYC